MTTWNSFQFGGELCQDPKTGEVYKRMTILDRKHGRARSGPITDDEIGALIDGLTKLRDTPLPDPA